VHIQVNAVTLGVKDPSRAKRFYSEGLGRVIQQDHGDYVDLSLGDGSSTLALYWREALADDAGVAVDGTGFPGFTMSYILDAAEDVDAVLGAAVRGGGEVIKAAKSALWGGYSGYFRDPEGFLWKVASTSKPKRTGRAGEPGAESQEVVRAVPNPQEIAVTLGANNLKRTKQFYKKGLDCRVQKSAPGFVSFNLGDGSSTLALYRREALAKDAGVPASGSGFRGFTLSLIVDSAADVNAALARAEGAGGEIAKPAQRAPWGGSSGYFTDSDGSLWKVASSP
jgi:uncharacterized glyoxalase superfamily protein PhnB